jgi:hypothetical protein
VVDPEKESSYNKKNGKGAHAEIVYVRRSPDKRPSAITYIEEQQ